MKIRMGFVTNSSSSSFLLAYKDLPKLDQDLLKEHPELEAYDQIIHDALEEEDWHDDQDSALIFDDEDCLKQFFESEFLDQHSWFSPSCTLPEYLANNPGDKKTYEDAISYIRKGYKVVYRTLSYDKKAARKVINGLIKTKKVISISEQEM